MDGPSSSSTAGSWTQNVAGLARRGKARVTGGWRRLTGPERPKPVRIAVYVVATILAIIVAIWLILYITKGRFLKQPFERIVSGAIERDVDVAGDFQLYFDPFNIKFLAEGLTIANPEWASRPDFFRSKLIDTRIATWTLLFGKDRINWLTLINGDVALEWEKGGRRNTWTFGDPEADGEPLDIPIIRRAIVQGTAVHYRDPQMQLDARIRIRTIAATDTQFDRDIRFTGDGTMRGKSFTMEGSLLSPNETVRGGENPLTLTARSGATQMRVAGTLPGAFELENAKLRIDVRGPNLSHLFDFLGVAVPDTRTYHFRSNLTHRQDSWRFTRLTGKFGESDLAGAFTISQPNNRLKIDADLKTSTLDIVDIGPFIGYDPERLERSGNAGAVRQVGGVSRVLPDAPLRVDALARFDADLRYNVARVRAENFPVSDIGLELKLDRNLLTLSPLTFALAGGHLASDIEINARSQPVRTRYDIRLAPTPMGKLLARFGVAESGTSGTIKARVQLQGTGDTVHKSLATSNGRIAVILPRGTLWTQNVQLAELDIGTFITKMFEEKLKEPVQINCGLIGFTVRSGIAAADPILIDTRKNVMLGQGGFSFRDEAIDLAIRADSKKFSLFSGQSPVGLGGHFAEPKLEVITPELLGRAGAGLGLGAALSPIASVLAFVDVGDAKAADCGPVLAGARATAQRTDKGKPRDDVGEGKASKSDEGYATKADEKPKRKKFLGIF